MQQRKPKRIFTVEEKQLIIYQYIAEKMTIDQLRQQLKSSIKTIMKILDEADIKRNSRKGRSVWCQGMTKIPIDQHESLLSDFNRGYSTRELASKYAVSKTCIKTFLQHNGKQKELIDRFESKEYNLLKKNEALLKRNRSFVRFDKDGYVIVYLNKGDSVFPKNKKKTIIMEHRLIMSDFLGRPLEDHETVHHINGIKNDNRLDNLELRIGHHGAGWVLCCRICDSFRVDPKPLSGELNKDPNRFLSYPPRLYAPNKTSEGYLRLKLNPAHPFYVDMAQADGTVLEHRLNMAEYLGRSLTKNENVHHINGTISDNNINNLQLRIKSHGEGQRWRCGNCGSIDLKQVAISSQPSIAYT